VRIQLSGELRIGYGKMLSGLSGLTSRQSADFPWLILSYSGSVLMEGASGQVSSGVGTSIEAKVFTPSMEATAQITSRSAGCSGAESFLLRRATPFVQMSTFLDDSHRP
jgi:hypothetical protein